MIFADKQTIFEIPNFKNVASNLALVIPALYLLQKQNKLSLLSIHILLLSIFSSYYHLNPSDDRIFWDMLCVVTTHIIVLSYFIDNNYYTILLYILGVMSLIYWKINNDLRPYILILIGIPLYILSLHYKNEKVKN